MHQLKTMNAEEEELYEEIRNQNERGELKCDR